MSSDPEFTGLLYHRGQANEYAVAVCRLAGHRTLCSRLLGIINPSAAPVLLHNGRWGTVVIALELAGQWRARVRQP